MTASVTSVRAVEYSVPDLAAAARFYQDIWGLSEVAATGGARYFRAAGPEHHVLVLRQSEAPAFFRLNLGAASRSDVDALYRVLSGTASATAGPPVVLDEPGGGYAFDFCDLEGRAYRVSADVMEYADAKHSSELPYKISHVVLNSDCTIAERDFFIGYLGFRLRDSTRGMDFLGCNADHHSLAFTTFGGNAINHVAFEVPTVDAVLRGTERLSASGYPMEWGVGRHGPGDNVFAYFLDDRNFAIEYTAEMEQVDDAAYRGKSAAEWAQRPPPDAPWGPCMPPTTRFERAIGVPPRPGGQPAAETS